MIMVIHLLEHLGVPSGVAIALVIAGKKALAGGASKIGKRRHTGQGRPDGYR